MHLTTTTCRKVTQTLVPISRELGLGREAWAASLVLRVKTRFECPEDNLRGLI